MLTKPILNLNLINETPPPVFSRLERPDDGMTGLVEVSRSMLIFRRITTADVTAGKAKAQLDPVVSCLQTLLAALPARLHLSNLRQMRAFLCAH